MPSAPHKRRSRRALAVLGLLTVAGLLYAVPASAASLTTTVTPSKVIVNHHFVIKVAGVGNPDDETQRVLAWTQPGSSQCKSDYLAEYAAVRHAPPKVATTVGTSPFSLRSASIRANVLGSRRVCTYLYSVDTHTTLLTSVATYKVQLPLCHRRHQRGCRHR